MGVPLLNVMISGRKQFETPVVLISVLLIISSVCVFGAESVILDFSSLMQAHLAGTSHSQGPAPEAAQSRSLGSLITGSEDYEKA